MLNSAEVRWFFPHKISADIKRWFLGPEYGGANPGPRADAYLVFPGCECLGVKQRGQEGGLKPKFEVKALRGAAETVCYPNGVSGRSDCWVKWSCGGEAVGHWIEALEREPNGWSTVKKTRWIRKFEVAGREVSEAKNRVDQGCNVELTEITVTAKAGNWWSLAFEAFGEPDRVRENLQLVASDFFSKNSHPPDASLGTVNSCSYPVWLASL